MSENSGPSTPLTIRIPPVTIENQENSITPIEIDNNEEFSFTEQEISLISESMNEEEQNNIVSSPSLLTPTTTENNISENLTETFEGEAADPVEETDVEDEETDVEDEETDVEDEETDVEDDQSEVMIDEFDDLLQQEEQEEQKEEEHKNEKESYECGVCYKSLHMDNSVVTKCKHHYCNDCFYRWIQTQATCPLCRTPINCNIHLTDEQLDRETSMEYMHYVHTLERNNCLIKRFMKTRENYSKLAFETSNLLNRQVSLRQMIDMTLAHNDGLIAARKKILSKSIFEKKMMEQQYNNSHDPSLYGAFFKAYKSEKKRLTELMNIKEPVVFSFKPPKQKITIKKRIFDEVDTATESKQRGKKHIKTSE